ncbi:podocalyxin-like protein 2 [Salmo trutta]|uniref:podocalyxin-like protein 2 n=1 Tax=Salmo trutta TaxID=8032 RepID=UPI00112FE57B|nr:podocalyxin-like protein 2 [Salmo trutta]
MIAGKEIQEKEQRQQQERRKEEERRNEEEEQKVICVDWSDLAGKGYVILNMSDNVNCDDFRVESGDRLLELLETAFSRKMNSPQGSWLISLSKPTRQDHQLLITLASEHGVIATKDMLSMLGEIRRGLHEIGIQNYSSANTCHSRPSQMRSDYGKLFVVLVIIGSVCVVIIASGLIYIFWQRRLPKIKTMTRGEEFHFVENGCHDNPTLDVTSDGGGQPDMQEKKHRHTNGLTAGSGGEGGSSGWQVLVNKPGGKEEDNMEEDTHL